MCVVCTSLCSFFFVFFKHKTAYEMRISDGSSDVCSSDLIILNEDNLSWKVGVDFKPVAGSLFYANVTKGYKAGSFPTITAPTVSAYRPVVQESVIKIGRALCRERVCKYV